MRTGTGSRSIVRTLVLQAVFALAFVCLQPAPSRAWLYYSVPPIQGTVTDATTGEPIANAVLVVKWTKTVTAIGDTVTVIMKKTYVATDDKGVYRIPSYWSTHVFSWFNNVNWTIRHPLYETDQRVFSRPTLDALRHPETVTEERRAEIASYVTKAETGELVFNISLLSLKEKFKDSPQVAGYRGYLLAEFDLEGPIYFLVAKKLGLQVDTGAVFKAWEDIAMRFNDVEYIQRALETGKRRVIAGDVEDY